MAEMRFDYVVVGGGTAGCLLAARLSEDPNRRVVLVEFGGADDNPAIYDRDMNAMFSLWNPVGAENYGYQTPPQPGLDGRAIDVARGKVIGGSSAVNAMIHIRGNRLDYDAWARTNPGWSYADVLPYFMKSETHNGQASPVRGTSGELSIIDYVDPAPVVTAFVEAAAAIGGGTAGIDLNGEDQQAGAGYYQSTRTAGDRVRVTAASAFIHPNRDRANLEVLLRHRVTRVVIENGRAVGVMATGPDGEVFIAASREVVLTAGTYETTKLMMLSGLGPAAHLAEHGIPVVADMPGVGENLQDHMLLGVAYECNEPQPAPEMLAEAGVILHTDSGREIPDLQYFFGPVQFIPQEYMTANPGFTFAPILAKPLSRGTIRLASANPDDNAVVDPHYLEREEDVAVFEFGIRYARRLVQHPAFDRFRGKELAPGADVTDPAGIRAYIRKAAGTVWHPVGTCKMGPASDPLAVVDHELKVHGIAGLRVADASIMPELVNANPNATVYMIAEKAADMIRAAHA
jgi:choline dehydrogenase